MEIIERFSDEKISSRTELEAVENLLRKSLPNDYADFLLAKNGGRPKPSVFQFFENGKTTRSRIQCLYGLSSNPLFGLLQNLRKYGGRIPVGFLPIACDGFGNQLLLSVRKRDHGAIWFWDHEQEADEPTMSNMFVISNSFSEFTENLVEP